MPPYKDSSEPAPPLMPHDAPTSTPLSDIAPRVHALVTPVTSSTSGSQAQVVVIDLNTLVTIPDFTRFYHTDPATFQPVYYALNDGSLVAPPFLTDLSRSNISLIITTFLLAIFARNIYTSATFIWCGKVRKKGLLYTVFLSQLLAPPALIPLLAAHFQRVISCNAVLLVTGANAGISLSLLVTGILGVKAYRCLDNSRLVLVVLLLLRTTALAFLTFELGSLQGLRSLSGRCYRITDDISSAFFILLLVESLFVCLCFLYAVWQSHGSVAARGRVAISLSMDDIPDPPVERRTQSMDTSHSRRGWWDYVPTADPSSLFSSRSRRTESHDLSARDGVRRFRSGDNVENSVSSIPPVPPLPLDYNSPPRTSTVRMSTAIQTCPNPRRESALPTSQRPSSPALSSMSRISRFMPRVALFKEVMRDELLYTTFITAFTVVSVVMTLIGVRSEVEIDHICWIGLDWTLISCLVMHSFGRVIRRHKIEALLQQPSSWRHNLYTDRSSAELLGEGRARFAAARSSFGRSSQARTRRSALTIRRHDLPDSLCDSSTRQLFPSSISESCDSRVEDTGSATPSSIGTSNLPSPVHKVDPFTGVHIILPTDQLTHGVDRFPSSGRDSQSSHRSDSPKNSGENVFRQMYDNSFPSIPLVCT
ncbi:hypothetical protein AZE42_00305 [Rhizopogon vesiculosus]|uniref:Uncharacterized protein n=1 Tax=Rhizopogon vesiculosus TaxID=180088 RepID=A0A1J8QGC5_9AGAM|nr:hypothetical protein AZE42_00305 [Rhizopogon vesiculosus]